jgi:apolipoprotein N-acyltransferase
MPVLLSQFIYQEYFNFNFKLINTICAVIALYLLFKLNKKELFFIGFITSIFWFWWISYSFSYYKLEYLIPIVIITIGIIYGLIFTMIGLHKNIYFKLGVIFLLTYVYPFGFNWFQLELLFINSYIGTSKVEFLVLLVLIALFSKYSFKSRFIFILPFIFIPYHTAKKEILPLNIELATTYIPQQQKWDRKYLSSIIENNFNLINKAIKNKKDLVILPETAFPLILNRSETITQKLLKLSQQINIITGALHYKDQQLHNSTYFFNNGKLQIAHKVVLIPFGEAVPFPKIIKDFINNKFYDGAKDYEPSLTPTDFMINNTIFRNAICYEATHDEIYKNMKGKYLIAISNNGWFTPSIQPTLQTLLLKYYAKKYNTTIISVTNMSKSTIIH